MKILFVSFFMLISQSSMAKIADFNSLINEHSKMQNEIHNSINAESAESIEVSGSGLDKKREIIVLDTNHEVYSEAQAPKKNGKKALNKKKSPQSDDIEEKHFQRLGEELDNAQ